MSAENSVLSLIDILPDDIKKMLFFGYFSVENRFIFRLLSKAINAYLKPFVAYDKFALHFPYDVPNYLEERYESNKWKILFEIERERQYRSFSFFLNIETNIFLDAIKKNDGEILKKINKKIQTLKTSKNELLLYLDEKCFSWDTTDSHGFMVMEWVAMKSLSSPSLHQIISEIIGHIMQGLAPPQYKIISGMIEWVTQGLVLSRNVNKGTLYYIPSDETALRNHRAFFYIKAFTENLLQIAQRDSNDQLKFDIDFYARPPSLFSNKIISCIISCHLQFAITVGNNEISRYIIENYSNCIHEESIYERLVVICSDTVLKEALFSSLLGTQGFPAINNKPFFPDKMLESMIRHHRFSVLYEILTEKTWPFSANKQKIWEETIKAIVSSGVTLWLEKFLDYYKVVEADLNTFNNVYMAVLKIAIEESLTEISEWLYHDKYLNEKTAIDFYPSLLEFAITQHIKRPHSSCPIIMSLLISGFCYYGGNINRQDQDQNTFLHRVAMAMANDRYTRNCIKHIEIMNALRQMGASLDLKNAQDKSVRDFLEELKNTIRSRGYDVSESVMDSVWSFFAGGRSPEANLLHLIDNLLNSQTPLDKLTSVPSFKQ